MSTIESGFNHWSSITPEKESSSFADSKVSEGKDQFLTLLVAQIKNQDPLKPMETTEFTSQLAQFSSLEQQFDMNKSLMEIKESLAVRENGNILDFIGKTVKTGDNSIFINDGDASAGVFNLQDRADVVISVYDEAGLEVGRIYEGWKDAGEHDFVWDGRADNGDKLSDGFYTYQADARDEKGYSVPCDTYFAGKVTGVTYETGDPYLMIGNKLVVPEDVVEIGMINDE